jgi:hypothetical protein
LPFHFLTLCEYCRTLNENWQKTIPMNRFIFLALLTALLCFRNGFTQTTTDTTAVFQVETLDGNVFTGTLIHQDSLSVRLKTGKLGELTFQRSDIKSFKELKGVVQADGRLWLPNPQSARYFWAPNGYGLEKGEGYYQNIWILYNQVSVGLTKNFSIGAGMLPLFLFGGAATPVFLVPKFSFPLLKEKVNLGAGAFLGTILGEETGVFGLLYGTSTFGSRDKNLSVGLAYGFAGDQMMDIPIINISGMVRVGPRGYLLTENYIITGGGETVVILSLGGRTIFRNVGLDYSLWIPFYSDMDMFLAMPFLGITLPIGKKK